MNKYSSINSSVELAGLSSDKGFFILYPQWNEAFLKSTSHRKGSYLSNQTIAKVLAFLFK